MPGKLNIAVDVRDLRVAKTGTRTYLEELCREFKKLNSDELQFYFIDTFIPVYTGKNKLLKWIEHFRYQFWKQLQLPVIAFAKRCHVVFCTDNFVPIIHLGYKTIPVFHDAFFFEDPHHYGKLWLWLYMKTAIPAANRAAFVITPTEYSKERIIKFTKIDPDKIVVVAEGPKSLEKLIHKDDSTIITTLNLNGLKYILHVGSMFTRKNIPFLIRAFNKIKTTYPELKLLLAGSPPSKDKGNGINEIMTAIEENGLNKDVIFTGYINNDELDAIYQQAALYVFPSLNEGFGIPVLEAFKYDLPILVANNTCLPEVGGDAVITFDPYNEKDLVAKIDSVLKNPQLQADLIKKGRKRLRDFSWTKAALEIVEVFKRAG